MVHEIVEESHLRDIFITKYIYNGIASCREEDKDV